MQVPHLKIYESDGITLVYTVPVLQYINIPQSIKKNYLVESIRGVGGIVIPGSDSTWDLVARFFIMDEDYEQIAAKIEALEDAIILHTPYVAKFEKSPEESYSYNVKRIEPIGYPESLRVNEQEVMLLLKVNTW